MALQPQPAHAPAAAKAQAIAAFAAAYHTGMEALHAKAREVNTRMATLADSAGPNGFTPQQMAESEALIAARRKINRTISEYAMIHNIVLNQSAEVANLIGAVAGINAGLRAELAQLNGIVTVITNLNGLMQTLTGFLTALAAVAAL